MFPIIPMPAAGAGAAIGALGGGAAATGALCWGGGAGRDGGAARCGDRALAGDGERPLDLPPRGMIVFQRLLLQTNKYKQNRCECVDCIFVMNACCFLVKIVCVVFVTMI